MTARWHTVREGDTLTLGRRAGMRFDVVAEAEWMLAAAPARADAFRLRLAHQVRQDVWRALQRVRGLTPVVSVSTEVLRVHVRAGADLSGGRPTARLGETLGALLADSARIARWTVTAQRAGLGRSAE
ncbi:MAG: hypothetical protein AAGK98_09880 [Pseudomonadota bacterium]